MRTEFAVLTGVAEEEIGFDQFDPYLRAYRRVENALPGQMSIAGFRCEFVHPYDRRFFRRDVAIPALGFHSFLDETAFPASERIGRYVSDRAVGELLLSRIKNSELPMFVYAATMENHGPWADENSYLKHLRNSDQLLGMMMEGLDRLGRDYVLAFFGDHRPALRSITSKGTTPFVILTNDPVSSEAPAVSVTAAGLNWLLHAAIEQDCPGTASGRLENAGSR